MLGHLVSLHTRIYQIIFQSVCSSLDSSRECRKVLGVLYLYQHLRLCFVYVCTCVCMCMSVCLCTCVHKCACVFVCMCDSPCVHLCGGQRTTTGVLLLYKTSLQDVLLTWSLPRILGWLARETPGIQLQRPRSPSPQSWVH